MPEFMIPDWLPDGLRYVIIGLVAPPAVGKFLTYAQSVAFFASLGIPSPELTVILVGIIELAAVVLLLIDVGRRSVGVSLLPVMLVAFWTTYDWQALVVLFAAIGLLAVEFDLLKVPEADPS